jgi:hypothetical protein
MTRITGSAVTKAEEGGTLRKRSGARAGTHDAAGQGADRAAAITVRIA